MPEATITITMTPEGQINVSGAITNKVMAYGLLEAAKDAIRDFHAKQTGPHIVPVTGRLNGHG